MESTNLFTQEELSFLVGLNATIEPVKSHGDFTWQTAFWDVPETKETAEVQKVADSGSLSLVHYDVEVNKASRYYQTFQEVMDELVVPLSPKIAITVAIDVMEKLVKVAAVKTDEARAEVRAATERTEEGFVDKYNVAREALRVAQETEQLHLDTVKQLRASLKRMEAKA